MVSVVIGSWNETPDRGPDVIVVNVKVHRGQRGFNAGYREIRRGGAVETFGTANAFWVAVSFLARFELPVSTENHIEAVYPDPDDEPEWSAQSVAVTQVRVRRKLARLGVIIRRVGYTRWAEAA